MESKLLNRKTARTSKEDGLKLENVFVKFSRKPGEVLTHLKSLYNVQAPYGFPPETMHGLTPKLLTSVQGHLNRELKKRNGEFVSVMLNVVCGVVKYQLEELEESPPADIVKRAADMIVCCIEKMADFSLNDHWITAISQAAMLVSLLTDYKPIGFGDCLLPLMKLTHKAHLDIEAKVKVCNAINESWEVYSSKVKEQLDSRGHIMNHCKQWLLSLPKAGDYELQLQLLEAVFRLTDSKVRAGLSKTCFSDQQLAKQFLNIEPKELDVGSRQFLNALNRLQGMEARVSSLPCLTFVLGSTAIPKPAEADEFWVDFNFGSKSLSCYVEEPTSKVDDEPTWIDIVIKSNYVATYRIQAAQESIVLLLYFKDHTPPLFPGCSKSSENRTLKIALHGQYYDQLSTSLEKVFGKMLLSPHLTLSTTSEHAVGKRKVSQAPVYVLISSKKSYTPVCRVSPEPKAETPKLQSSKLRVSETLPRVHESKTETPKAQTSKLQASKPCNSKTCKSLTNDPPASKSIVTKLQVPDPSKSHLQPKVSSHRMSIPEACNPQLPVKGIERVQQDQPDTAPVGENIPGQYLNMEDKAGVKVSPICCSPTEVTATTTAALTPPNQIMPSFSPKTSTPKGFQKTLESSVLSSKKNEVKTVNHSTTKENSAHKSDTVNRVSIERDFEEISQNVPTTRAKAASSIPNPRVATGSISCTRGKLGRKQTGPMYEQERKPLQNITNKQKKQPKKAAAPTSLAGDTVEIELDVVQDSMPIVEKAPKKQTRSRKNMKGKAKHAPVKRPHSPGWILNSTSRSLATAGSANVSRTSTTGDQDPYQFDSDDGCMEPLPKKAPKLPPKSSNKWHERDTVVKSAKKVYSNKGKVQRSFDQSIQQTSFVSSLANSPPKRESVKLNKVKPKVPATKSSHNGSKWKISMPALSEGETESLSSNTTDDVTYMPTGERCAKELNCSRELTERNNQRSSIGSRNKRKASGSLNQGRRKPSKPTAKKPQSYLKPFVSPAESQKLESFTPEPSPDEANIQPRTRSMMKKENSCKKVSSYLLSLPPSACAGTELPDRPFPGTASYKEGVSEIISLPYPDICSYDTSRDQQEVDLETPCVNMYASDSKSPIEEGQPQKEVDVSMCDSPEQVENMEDITLEFAAHCNNIIAQSERGVTVNSPQGGYVPTYSSKLTKKVLGTDSSARKRKPEGCTRQHFKKTRKTKNTDTPLTCPIEVPATQDDDSNVSIISGPSCKDDAVCIGNSSPQVHTAFDHASLPSADSPHSSSESYMPPSEGLRHFQQVSRSPFTGLSKKRPVIEQDSMMQVVRSTTKTAHKHASKLWRLHSGEWRSLVERYSKDIFSVVSTIEEDVGTTCRSLSGIQKTISTAESEHRKFLHSLTIQEDRLQDLTEMQQAFGKDWKKAGTELSHKKAAITRGLRKDVDIVLKEFSAKSQQEGMDKIRHSVQSWLMLNL